MTTVIDVSSRLGEYMLKGWVLTDRICIKCSRVPLMRSPSSADVETHLCVDCDPLRPAPLSSKSLSAPLQDTDSTSGTSNDSGVSHTSTAPTEVSDAPSSPVFAPIMDSDELLRRRHQSDTASVEIGKRMLRGWAMLADECPGPDCFGIPLVRPPKTGATIDPRKECVICGTVYVYEKDVSGQDHLVPMQPSPSSADTYRVQGPAALAQSSSAPSINNGVVRANTGIPFQPQFSFHGHHIPNDVPAPPSESSTLNALKTSVRSLERSLHVLSEQLNDYTARLPIDSISIGQTADAIFKVSQALTQVKQLLWSESRALLG